jgi:steroid delta-isomerase-like uncharacterized protein
MSAKEIATQFFNAYRAQDVNQMSSLFTDDSIIQYVPFGEAGIGGVQEVGVRTWKGLIEAFPDLTNKVNNIWQDETGLTAFVDVNIGGTQTKDAFGIQNQGKHYWLSHLFIVQIDNEERITKLISYWDNADWYRQLGKTSLDT